MNRIGILGGMSWQSTAAYYRMINEGVHAQLGGLHSAEILLASMDFAPLEEMQVAGNWPAIEEVLVRAAQGLQIAGAQGMMIATNTMHKVAEQIETAISAPLLHIADATGECLVQRGFNKVALLGTAFTMEQDFYTRRLREKFGLEVIIPNAAERETVHYVIYKELCVGDIKEQSRQAYLRIIDRLAGEGAQASVLACTEIGLLVEQRHTAIPLIDTTELHAQMAIDFVLGNHEKI